MQTKEAFARLLAVGLNLLLALLPQARARQAAPARCLVKSS
jgi:hypothetical protein